MGKKNPDIFCVFPCGGVLVGWQQWWGVSKWDTLDTARPTTLAYSRNKTWKTWEGFPKMKTAAWSSYLIFLVIHLPARTVVESPSLDVLENVWMWPWRTWFSGDRGGAAGWWLHLVISLPACTIPLFGWWAHRPSLIREEGTSPCRNSSPKAEVFSHLPGSQPEQGQCVRVNKSWLPEGFVPSTTQPFVCVTSLALELWKRDLKLKPLTHPWGKSMHSWKGHVQCFCWKLFWANPGLLEHGADPGCWLRNAGNVSGMFSQTGMRGWVRR